MSSPVSRLCCQLAVCEHRRNSRRNSSADRLRQGTQKCLFSAGGHRNGPPRPIRPINARRDKAQIQWHQTKAILSLSLARCKSQCKSLSAKHRRDQWLNVCCVSPMRHRVAFENNNGCKIEPARTHNLSFPKSSLARLLVALSAWLSCSVNDPIFPAYQGSIRKPALAISGHYSIVEPTGGLREIVSDNSSKSTWRLPIRARQHGKDLFSGQLQSLAGDFS